MAICGVYGIKGKKGISNESANQNESLPLKKIHYIFTYNYYWYLFFETLLGNKIYIWLTLKFCPTIHEG